MQFGFKLFLILAPVFVFLFFLSQTKKLWLTVITSLFLLSISTITILNIAKYIYHNYDRPPEWDFLVFWLDGHVAIKGENFYNPQSYQNMSLPYDPDNSFKDEIINVGFKYPPFAMFLFMSLGLLNISRAYLIWQILNLLLSLGCIYWLWKLFLNEYGLLSFLLIAALLFRLTPAFNTFYFAQTNFIALFIFLVFWKNRSKTWSGILLTLGIMVKPYTGILYLYPILKKNWGMLWVTILSLLLLLCSSLAVFGLDVFQDFFINITSKVPVYLYTEAVNQSILAAILRANQNQIVQGPQLLNPLYLAISLTLSLITGWVAVKNIRINDTWVILSILFLALIVYPATLQHYSTFLILPVVLLLQQARQQNIGQRIITLCTILIIYVLSGNETGNFTLAANIFTWLICIMFSLNLFQKQANRIKVPLSSLELER